MNKLKFSLKDNKQIIEIIDNNNEVIAEAEFTEDFLCELIIILKSRWDDIHI